MNAPPVIADLDRFVATRLGLQAIAEHVLAKARFTDDGSIRLLVNADGFATPVLTDGRRVSVEGIEIVVSEGTESRRQRIESVGGAAAFVGVTPGFPTELQPAATALSPDASLDLDPASAAALGAWFGFAADVFATFASELVDVVASPAVLWPEHFDLAIFTEDAIESRRANYGASPGDAGHPEPYLYVGPWGSAPANAYWNAVGFTGAVLSLPSLVGGEDAFQRALNFLRAGRSVLTTLA